MDTGGEAKPAPEALEQERRRLKELERNLAAERARVQAAAAQEIARMQGVLREAAQRAARRERELEAARKRLERKLERGLVVGLGRLLKRGGSPRLTPVERRERALAEREAVLESRERKLNDISEQAATERARLKQLEASLRASHEAVEGSEAARMRELEEREAALARRVEELVDVERRSAQQLAVRAAELDALGRALAEREAALQDRDAAIAAGEQAPPPTHVPRPVSAVVDMASEQEHAAQLRDVARREAALADRTTVLDDREAELAETIAALDRQELELAGLREELETERGRLAARWRRLGEAERSAPVRAAYVHAVGFSEGLHELARKRGAS